MYKCAIIGVSGGRANGHADAYRLITRGKLVAVSTRNRTNLDAFAAKHNVPARYTDYREMFRAEKPDLVHVNTPPDVRAEVMRAADDAGVPALIIEKPIALQAEDYREVASLARTLKTRVAINHQLHFHPNRAALQDRVAAGDIGAVRFIDASARLNLSLQGTHMLQSIAAFNPGGTPETILAQASGATSLTTPRARLHYAPDLCLAAIAYSNGARAQLLCGEHAPTVAGAPGNQMSLHKRVSIYGELGQAHWSMWNWSITDRHGKTSSGTHDYFEQDIRAQAAMTQAMFDWLENPAKIHPLNLDAALLDFNIILGLYTSALSRQIVRLPLDPPADLLAKLRTELSRT